MTFKRFLIEGRTKQISEQEARTLFTKNCTHFKPHKLIYRGLNAGFDYGFIDPKKVILFSRRVIVIIHSSLIGSGKNTLDEANLLLVLPRAVPHLISAQRYMW